MTKAVYDFLEKEMATSNGKAATLNSFWSSAIVCPVISKWIKDGMKIPAEKIAVYLPPPTKEEARTTDRWF